MVISARSVRYLVIFCSLLVIACKQKEDTVPIFVGQLSKEEISKMSWKVRVLGDTVAYETLRDHYRDSTMKFLSHAFEMSGTHEYSRAYYDLYEIFKDALGCEGYSLDCTDKSTKEYVLRHFKEAIYAGDPEASKVLLEYYMKGAYFPEKVLYEDSILVNTARSVLNQ